MKQIYIEYNKWEDYIAGMYCDNNSENKELKIKNSIMLLSDAEDFYNTCKELCVVWINATNVNLSNVNQNRKAWLGAAACMYKYGAQEYITRIAWSMLEPQKQHIANKVAHKIISEYEAKNRKLHTNVGKSLLF